MIMPATLSMIRQVFPDRRERAIALGVWSAVAAAGAAVGPLDRRGARRHAGGARSS